MNQKLIVIGMTLATLTTAVKASPRTQYLSEKLQEAKRIEVQSKSKYEASKRRYRTAEAYADSITKELKQVRKREAKEYKAAQRAAEAEYAQVNPYLLGDMSAPTQIKWRTR